MWILDENEVIIPKCIEIAAELSYPITLSRTRSSILSMPDIPRKVVVSGYTTARPYFGDFRCTAQHHQWIGVFYIDNDSLLFPYSFDMCKGCWYNNSSRKHGRSTNTSDGPYAITIVSEEQLI